MSKKVGVVILPILFLLVFLLPVYRVVNADQDVNNDGVPTTYVGNQQIQDIKKIIGDKTPNFLANPIIAVVEFIEGFRTSMDTSTKGNIVNPIFNNALIFYAILFVIVVLVFRFLWRLIFKHY